MRNIEVIGQAADNIQRHCSDFIAKHANVRWDDVYWVRHPIPCDYLSVDLKVIWAMVQYDLPELEQQILKLQRELKELKALQHIQRKSKIITS